MTLLRWMTMLGRLTLLRWLMLSLLVLSACGLRPAVSLRFAMQDRTPRDASVFIDEEFIGLLGYVASHGVRLPKGDHRLTIERDGYFPLDLILHSDREPIALSVQLTPIPD